MADFYSRAGSALMKKEAVNNTPVKPDTAFGFNEEDIAVEYGFTPSMPVAGNRSKNINPVINAIPAPEGTVTVYANPTTFGNFLEGLTGGLIDGKYIPLSSVVGEFVIGETVTGGTSAATAVVLFVGENYLITATPTGTPVAGETVTGGTSAATATVVGYDATVIGHAGTLPVNNTLTYTMQFQTPDIGVRFIGVRITGLDSVAQEDNIITAGVKIMAQGQFRHARVMEAVTAGAGSKTITVDQTYGLLATDTIKLYRPGTGFIDFVSASVKTHTINAVTNQTQFTVTNVQANILAGDLIVLAPITPAYVEEKEFAWIGGSTVEMADTMVGPYVSECMEDFTLVMNNEYEARHCANGFDFKDRFPEHIIQKSLEITGTFTTKYSNEDFIRKSRKTEASAVRWISRGDLIAGGIYRELRFNFPRVYFPAYQINIGQDDIVNEEIPFTAFYDLDSASMAQILLVNTTANY